MLRGPVDRGRTTNTNQEHRLAEPPVRALEVGAIEPPGDPHRAARQQREASVLGLLHQLELFLPPRAVGS